MVCGLRAKKNTLVIILNIAKVQKGYRVAGVGFAIYNFIHPLLFNNNGMYNL